MYVLVTQLCPTLCDPMDLSPPGSSCLWNFPGKDAGVGCHFLLQGLFLTQGLNLSLPCWCMAEIKSILESNYPSINNKYIFLNAWRKKMHGRKEAASSLVSLQKKVAAKEINHIRRALYPVSYLGNQDCWRIWQYKNSYEEHKTKYLRKQLLWKILCVCVCVCAFSHVELFAPPWAVACQVSLSWIFQARILDCVAISFSPGSSLPRNQTYVSWVSCLGKWILYH